MTASTHRLDRLLAASITAARDAAAPTGVLDRLIAARLVLHDASPMLEACASSDPPAITFVEGEGELLPAPFFAWQRSWICVEADVVDHDVIVASINAGAPQGGGYRSLRLPREAVVELGRRLAESRGA